MSDGTGDGTGDGAAVGRGLARRSLTRSLREAILRVSGAVDTPRVGAPRGLWDHEQRSDKVCLVAPTNHETIRDLARHVMNEAEASESI